MANGPAMIQRLPKYGCYMNSDDERLHKVRETLSNKARELKPAFQLLAVLRSNVTAARETMLFK